MAGSIYQLPTINADTNAGTGAMAGASQSFSHAGTVFGELRKSILDEEQRAIENAYNEKKMAEQIRQFNEQLGWDKNKFAQDLGFRREELDETKRYHSGSLANQAAGLALQRQEHDFLRQKWAEQKAREDDARNRFMNALYRTSGQEYNDQLKAWNEERRQAFGDKFFEDRQNAQNYVNRYEAAVEANGGALPDTLKALNANIQYQNAKRVLADSDKELAAYESIYTKPENKMAGTSSLERGLQLAMMSGDPSILQHNPFLMMTTEGLKAQREAAEAEAKRQDAYKLAGYKARLDAENDAISKSKTRRELFEGRKINDSYWNWTSSNMNTIQSVANQLGYDLSDKQALGIIEETYNFKPEGTYFGLFSPKSSPAGFTSLWNGEPSRLTPEEIIEAYSDKGRTILELIRSKGRKQKASK